MADTTQTSAVLGQDPYQIADAINRQKVSDTRKRNEMMRLGTSDPSSFYMQNQREIQQAQMPTEFLAAGRTSDIPTVSMDGQQYQTLSNDSYNQMLGKMPELGTAQYSPDYTNDVAKYYSPTKATELNNLSNIYSYMDKLSKPYTLNTNLLGNVQGTPSDLPSTATEFMSRYGSAPENGWNDATTYRGTNVDSSLQGWLSNTDLLPNFSLAGSGSDEDIQKGFNLLQHFAPRNINEFWSLSKDAQLGMLEHPDVALQQMRALANPANGDWLSVGAEGGFSNMNAYDWSNTKGLTTDPNQYMQIHDDNRGLLGSLDEFVNKIDPLGSSITDSLANSLGYENDVQLQRAWGEPIGNLMGAIFLGGIPVGSMVMAADNASTGNDKAIMGNVINGLVAAGGANGYLGDGSSVMNSGVDLGSTTANTAANNFLTNTATNYARTGDLESSLEAAAFSTAAGTAGNWLGEATRPALGDIASKALGGAASGGINSLFTKGSPLAGSLYGGMSGGLYGLLNSMGKNGEGIVTKEDNQTNKQLAKTATQLARLFINK